jgi:hypothetical protein
MAPGLVTRAALGEGLEPSYRGPKPRVLPLDDPRKNIATTMRRKRSIAVRADNPQVYQTIVVPNSIYVVKNHGDSITMPCFVLSTYFTNRDLKSRFIQSSLQVSAVIGGVLDQNVR